MKTIGLALLISIGVCYGQNNLQSREPQKRDTDYAITSKDGNSQVWEKTEYEPSADGKQIPHVHRYTELATGLNYLKDGQWTASKEEIQVLPDGGAAAVQGQHQVYFPGNIYQGEIELITPDGKHVKSRPMGLSYDDGQNTVLIAELKDSVGYLVSSNQIVYPDAFTDFKADLRYTYTKAGFEQDIILREQPPVPATFNMNPDETHLQLLTEFFDAEEPTAQRAEDTDTQLSFGQMTMVRGKAFSTDNTSAKGIPVSKSWQKLSGRDFLIEELPVSSMAEELEALPVSPQLSKVNSPIRNKLSATRLLPPVRLAQVTTNTIQLAKADFNQQKGFVLDYQTVNGNYNNFVFQGDTTYYISGLIRLVGTNFIEGGAVLKYTNTGNIQATYLISKASQYRMAILTSKDDNTVGETISGSTGSPTNTGANYLVLPGAPSTNRVLRYLRFAYAGTAIYEYEAYADTSVTPIWDCQFLNCNIAVRYATYANYVSMGFYNVLFSNCGTALANDYASYHGQLIFSGQNITLDQVTNMMTTWSGDSQSHYYNNLKNSILSNVKYQNYFTDTGTTDQVWTTQCVLISNSSSGIFQTVGGGSYYLTNGSPYRNAGTTNIDATLLAELRQKTTYPPIVYSNVTIATATTLSPQAQRDTDTPDLGYHYDPLDYAFGGCVLTTNLTVTAGTAIGLFETYGSVSLSSQPYAVALNNGANLTSSGTANQPVWMTRTLTVQEGNGNWATTGWMSPLSLNGNGSSPLPQLNGQFTKFSVVANIAGNFQDNWAYGIVNFKNSEFYVGNMGSYRPSHYYTNCFFFRVSMAFWDQMDAANVNLEDCTFYNGFLALCRYAGQSASFWNIQNTAFDGTAFLTSDNFNGNPSYTAFDYNAYNGSNNSWATYNSGYVNTNRLETVGLHDVIVTNFNWQSSWLGNYYLPTNSTLIDAGSTTANQVGLYHFTTQTNQTKETNSIVDIGYHYVATDNNGNPVDTDGDGISDYLEDANGNGAWDTNETDWALAIITQPTDQIIIEGSNTTLSVTADGIGPFTYQWYFNSLPVSYATNATLEITNALPYDEGYYYVEIGSPYGLIDSSGFYLRFIRPPVLHDGLRGVNSTVYAIAVGMNNMVYVGGAFTQAGDSYAGHVAFWNPTTKEWSPLYQNPAPYNGDGVGGWSEININGTLYDDGVVRAIAVDTNNRVYVGGLFSGAGGLNGANLAVWDPAQTNWSSTIFAVDDGVRPNTHVAVNGMAIADNKLYVVGDFPYVGANPDYAPNSGTAATNIAMWNISDSTWHNIGQAPPVGIPNTIALFGSNIYVGGNTVAQGSWSNGIITWKIMNTNLTGSVKSIVFTDTGRMFIGGLFFIDRTSYDKYGVAEWNQSSQAFDGFSNWKQPWGLAIGPGRWPADGEYVDAVNALCIESNSLIVGGQFQVRIASSISNIDAEAVAKLDLGNNNWTNLLPGNGIVGEVNALATYNYGYTLNTTTTTNLIFGGTNCAAITNWYSVTNVYWCSNCIPPSVVSNAYWTNFISYTNCSVTTNVVYQTNLIYYSASPGNGSGPVYVGGIFDTIPNDQCADNIGAWDSSIPAWSPLTINQAPQVSLSGVSEGQVFLPNPNISLTADASDDCRVTNVNFLQGIVSLGTDAIAPYSYVWNAVPSGTYTLAAEATDNDGATATSSPITIRVDAAPTASITSPSDGATFSSPVNITINANAADSDGSVSKVDFYQDGVYLGTSTSTPYSYTWNSASVGSHSLTAIATDNDGATKTSTAVNITVH